MNSWYKTNTGYYEPGADAASTVWEEGPGSAYGNRELNIVQKDFPKF